MTLDTDVSSKTLSGFSFWFGDEGEVIVIIKFQPFSDEA